MIFEMRPAAERMPRYRNPAVARRPRREAIDGLVPIERGESLTEPGKLLSLSFSRGAATVAAWRNRPSHRATQRLGPDSVVGDDRVRAAAVVRDHGLTDREEAPDDSRAALSSGAAAPFSAGRAPIS